jgi:uncharacterized membrane protein YdjX (TVP38/TMEM64 family)/rhodanese-related sulfurtransferase
MLLALAVIAGAAGLALYQDHIDLALIERTVHSLGWWAPLAHVVLFALATVLFVPGALFALAGGALFGPLWGTVFNLTGATLGATAAFLVARYLAADRLRRRLGGTLDRLVAGVEAEDWRFVAFVRLVPLFPFNLLNYALGLTRIPLARYVFASLVCMAPGALAFAWLGHAGRGALTGDDVAIRYGLIALAAIAAIAFLPRFILRLRGNTSIQWIGTDELATRLGASELAVIDVRGPDEFIGPLGHIAGARNLPLAELIQKPDALAATRGQTVVLVCRTDKRSSAAAEALRGAGFREVRVLRGGMERWNQGGVTGV